MTGQEVKFTDEEMKEVSEIQEAIQTVTFQMGNIRIERLLLDRHRDKLADNEDTVLAEYDRVRKAEEVLVHTLNEKYGVGSLNSATGVFTPDK